jgi:hypothetical protein
MASTAAARSANRIEITIGRTAAACAHPLKAWHTARRSLRVMVVVGYFSIGFSTVLTVLLLA